MTYLADTVTLTGTQTLTNKTITSAAFSGTQTGTFTTTGNITIDSAGSATLALDKAAASDFATLEYKTAGNNDWAVTSNATSKDYSVLRYISGAYQEAALNISNSTGDVTIANDLLVTGSYISIDTAADALLYLDKNASGNLSTIVGRTNGANRWYLSLGSSAAETGSDAGSDFVLNRYNDAGAFVAQGMSIIRSNGYVDFPGAYNETTASAANVFIASNGSLQRSTSSLRYKINVEDMTYGLKDVLALRPVTYSPKPNGENEAELGKRYGGLIAEEVDAAGLKEFVGYNDEGQPDSLHYGHMVALCIKAIQDQQEIINGLKAEIAALKANTNQPNPLGYGTELL